MSFLAELRKDDYFGEISFFSTLPRQATVKSIDYTDVFTLVQDEFMEISETDDIALVRKFQILIIIIESFS